MIGLSECEAQIYSAACAYEAQHDAEPRIVDIVRAVGTTTHTTRKRIYRCIRKGFLCFDDDRRLIINEPPHERVMRRLCEETGFTMDEIAGRERNLPLYRVRRTAARRLSEFHYTSVDIGKLLKRHPSVIYEFLKPGYGTANKYRWIARRKARLQEAAQCMA